METFAIVVQRMYTHKDLVTGKLLVNGEPIGATYENDGVKIAAGTYVVTCVIDQTTILSRGPRE